jgi:hypothetical protein
MFSICREDGKDTLHIGHGSTQWHAKLGLLPQGPHKSIPQSKVVKAFKDTYTFLDTAISEERKAHMHFDATMVEHLICKYSKLYPKKVISRKLGIKMQRVKRVISRS